LTALIERQHGQSLGAPPLGFDRRRYSRCGAHPPYAARHERHTAV